MAELVWFRPSLTQAESSLRIRRAEAWFVGVVEERKRLTFGRGFILPKDLVI